MALWWRKPTVQAEKAKKEEKEKALWNGAGTGAIVYKKEKKSWQE